jgi:hypothetical protein
LLEQREEREKKKREKKRGDTCTNGPAGGARVSAPRTPQTAGCTQCQARIGRGREIGARIVPVGAEENKKKTHPV